MASGEQAGLALRLTGSVAIRQRCPGAAGFLDDCGRGLKDIDLVMPKKDIKGVKRLIQDLGYVTNQATLLAFEGRRLLFESGAGFLPPIDVFVDEISFCHRIDLRQRLTLGGQTLAPADLLLAKLQIVDISTGDLHDLLALLLEYDLGSTDDGAINAGYVARLLAADWGFHYTVTANLHKLRTAAAQNPHLERGDAGRIIARVDALQQRIEAEPKTARWKVRARVGTRLPWYNRVEETQRAL